MLAARLNSLLLLLQRIAAEVESLLVQSEALLSTGVRESSELGNLAWDLRCLHDDFRQQLDTRNTSLKKAVSFFMTSDQVSFLPVYRIMGNFRGCNIRVSMPKKPHPPQALHVKYRCVGVSPSFNR